MRLIDADALQKEYQKEHGKRLLLIDVAPTIDAVERIEYEKMKDLAEQYKFERDVLEESQRNKVEVVRCKDCKFGVYEKGCGIYHIRCEILEFLFQDDDYCSYGERKDR